MADTVQQHWDEVWSGRQPHEVSWYEPDPSVSRRLIEQVTRPDQAVVDVGGGASCLVDLLLHDGFQDLTVLDVAAAALAQARRRLGARASRVRWEVADVTRWDPGRLFALWHDRAVFHFLVDDEDRRRYLDKLRSSVVEGGHVVLATFGPSGPDQCSGLPVRRQDRDDLVEALGPDFSPVELLDVVHRTPLGADQAFLYGLFRRDGG